jgi:hypothetical protein
MKEPIMQTSQKKIAPSIVVLAIVFVLGTDSWFPARAQSPSGLTLRVNHNAVELQWPAHLDSPQGPFLPIFEVQQSTDLKQWRPVGQRMDARRLAAGESCRMSLAAAGQNAFYRFMAIRPKTEVSLGSGGEQVFGFGTALTEALLQIGQISPADFAARHPSGAEYLPEITWDPTAARYWDLFNADPAELNRGKEESDPTYRNSDFRLNGAELALFRKNGFVVSERLGTFSFADAFYRLWQDDLPVYISTDAILQAWHRSFDMFLREMEEVYLYDSLQRMLEAMAAQLPSASSQAPSGFPRECLQDADYFLTVARSLLAGTTAASSLGTDARVAETLAWVNQEKLQTVPDFFGSCREVDFSQFKPRGHYTETGQLSRYFRAMMWCGRTDVVAAGGPYRRCFDTVIESAPPRELGIAIVLWHLLNQSGEFETWRSMDRVIQSFVGWTDSMTFAQLGGVLSALGIRSLSDVPDAQTIQAAQAAILKGEVGAQHVRSDYFVSPLGPEQIQLPRTFTVLGQKFVLDSWALANLVYDSIIWDEDGIRGEEDKVVRRVPSGLDVAFSVLGNDQTVPELVARMTNPNARQSTNHAVYFRDGLPYQHNLEAVREVVEQLIPKAWQESLYMNWLGALRELSAPTTTSDYPDAMRTRAWAMKTLNTQLASWTHLRHDTILYAKQSYTGVGRCYYPEGFVEPRPLFWASLRRMAGRAAEMIGSLRMNEESRFYQENQITFLGRFANTVAMLQQMSEAELAGRAFSLEQQLFIRNLLEHVGWDVAGCGVIRHYDGWYPGLFYRGKAAMVTADRNASFQRDLGCDKWDLVLADVHTDLPSDVHGDPGSVLHEGVGNVDLLMLTVQTPTGPAVFAGPVLSYFEFELVGAPERLSDEEWKQEWSAASQWWDRDARDWHGLPNHPEWTHSYLVGCPR